MSGLHCQGIVIIPNLNGRQHLERCLPSVYAQSWRNFTLFLVDNGSTDGSVEWVQRAFPQVHVIRNQRNVGFAAANNQAIRASASEFVATLNNDTEVDADWLGALVEAMAAEPDIGMCASRMMRIGERNTLESAGVLVDKLGYAWHRGAGSRDTNAFFNSDSAFGPCAGAALYRRTMLEEIGLFDEDFFAYLEDVDLAWRAQWAGWKCRYVPEAVVYHAHSATAKEGSAFKLRLLGRNKVWMVCKNYPYPHILWYAPLIFLYDWMAVGYGTLRNRNMATLRGRLEALTGIPRMLAKRRRMLRRISAEEMMSRLCPVEHPLAVLRRYRGLSRSIGVKELDAAAD